MTPSRNFKFVMMEPSRDPKDIADQYALVPTEQPTPKPMPPEEEIDYRISHPAFPIIFLVWLVLAYCLWKLLPRVWHHMFHNGEWMEDAALEQIRQNPLAVELLGEPINVYRFKNQLFADWPTMYTDKKRRRRVALTFHVQGSSGYAEVFFEQRKRLAPLGEGKGVWFVWPFAKEGPVLRLEIPWSQWETMNLRLDIPWAQKRLIIEEHPDIGWLDTWSLPIWENPISSTSGMDVVVWWDKWSK